MVELPQETWGREAAARFRRVKLERQRQKAQAKFVAGMAIAILTVSALVTFYTI